VTARNFLVRGLLVGLLSGLAAFLVAHEVGEPHVERAVALEEAEVSRSHQRTWGLLTGTLAVGTVLGGFVALLSAGLVGRLGRLTAVQSTLTVAATGFVSYSLVPFLKYPANPPSVGSADTIGDRTTSYFALVLVSVLAAVAAVAAARALSARLGGLPATVLCGSGYVVAMAVVAVLMPTVDEVGSFPADELWGFRLSSLLTLAAMWTVIGVGLALAVDRLAAQDRKVTARRELAASL
jgi:hypothetical protein